MAAVIEKPDIFEQIMVPVDTMIGILFDSKMKYDIENIYSKYRKDIFKNPNAAEEVLNIIKSYTKECLSYLAENYLKYVEKNYYNQNGLIIYISAQLQSAAKKILFDRLDSEENDDKGV